MKIINILRKISSNSFSSSFYKHYSMSEQMLSSSDTDLITLLNNVSMQLNRYFAIFIFLFGTIGNIINVLVLSQRPLRSNPCAWLLLVSSIVYSISILTGLLPRFLSTWNADVSSTNQVLCKIRIFIFFNSYTVAFWLIVLATFDRWLSSSTNVNRPTKKHFEECTAWFNYHYHCFNYYRNTTALLL